MIMKNIGIILFLIVITQLSLLGQIKIGDNPTKIDSTSLLELESKNKGLLLPRISTEEMMKMKAPNGMLIFNSDSSKPMIRANGEWKLLSNNVTTKTSDYEDDFGYVFVHKFCEIGDGTFYNPWRSIDSSAGIKQALKKLSPTKRILYFKPGYYATSGNVIIDFEKELPNLSDPLWRTAFAGNGLEFQGHGAAIYVNGGAPLLNQLPGLLFNWPNHHAFYWKFIGLQFYGVVDNPVVQFGKSYEFPFNGCEFDIVGNNGYVYPEYLIKESPASAMKICWALESKLHLVAVSATGSGAILETATFCTIQGAFSNTIIPGTNTIYPNSFGLNLINCQSNTFTSMDLEIAYSGIKFDQWSIQNTFSAIFVSQGDSTGATFDNSKQVTNGKNVVISIRSGPTVQEPSVAKAQKLFTLESDSSKFLILNYFDF